ncbi:MAG: hypothetical protein HC799_19265 [Limnothrix sp. RL_2_0]|nr:hypothetical protein [Limnothrix sp. RL_2_0]
MSTKSKPICWIIAGPNGAGKTTFALNHLPEIADCQNFVNADLIAAGLNPLSPESMIRPASRLFLAEIENRIKARENFGFETTLAGRSYLKLIRRLKADGWRVELIYLALPSAKMSQMRVQERVIHGGHDIPVEDIYRRFPRSLKNLLTEFSQAADSTLCFMNTGETPELIFEQEGSDRTVINDKLFKQIREITEL